MRLAFRLLHFSDRFYSVSGARHRSIYSRTFIASSMTASGMYIGYRPSVATSRSIDLRSDTVTKPDDAMRKAMMDAPVGDDVFGEDPTVNQLEETVAKLAGKEAALFCTSGTLSNQLAIRTHLVQPPYTVLCDARAHILNYEAAGISFHSGAGVISVLPSNGNTHLSAANIKKHLIIDDDIHHAPTRLICLENTLNGSIMPIESIKEISALAKDVGIPLHLDGARIWNATTATGLSLKDYCQHFDTVSLCFSKGLGAPVGSVLVGPTSHIKRARHFRKLFGGGWRQAGILAAACLYAIDHIWPRLQTDHRHARRLAEHAVSLGFTLDRPVETNLVWINTQSMGLTAQDVADAFAKRGIHVFGGRHESVMRWVLHHQISSQCVDTIIQALSDLVADHKEQR